MTVASRASSSMPTGLPRIALRPTTTARFPDGSTPYSSSSRMIPPGVQDTKPGRPKLIVAKEAKVTPSTSFPGAIASNAARSSMCSPTGGWRRMPCTPGSADSASSVPTSSPVVVAAGSVTCREVIPALRQRFCFIRT
ncbi:hypothetical protein GCM10010303_66440 [Streptomyces purpurascens]|nr:hypothetical protein GCM10010303_66440 [Streptomyces purpurascens]